MKTQKRKSLASFAFEKNNKHIFQLIFQAHFLIFIFVRLIRSTTFLDQKIKWLPSFKHRLYGRFKNKTCIYTLSFVRTCKTWLSVRTFFIQLIYFLKEIVPGQIYASAFFNTNSFFYNKKSVSMFKRENNDIGYF